MAFWRYRSLSSINKDLVEQIAERRKAESDLELFKNLLNKSSEAIFVNDPRTGRFMDMNDRACAGLGYDRAELLTMGVRDIELIIIDDQMWQDHVAEVRRQGFLTVQGTHKRKDGSTFPVETNVSFVKLGDREYMIAVVRDITERKHAEAELRMREKQLAESQRIAHIGSWEHNLTTGRIFWSDELFRLLGIEPGKDQADFSLFLDRVHPDDRSRLKKCHRGDRSTFTSPSISSTGSSLTDGTLRTIHAMAELMHDETGSAQHPERDRPGHHRAQRGRGEDPPKRAVHPEHPGYGGRGVHSHRPGIPHPDRQQGVLRPGGPHHRRGGRQALLRSIAQDGKALLRGGRGLRRPASVRDRPSACCAAQAHGPGRAYAVRRDERLSRSRTTREQVISVIETVNNITEKHLLEEERLKTQKLESIGTLAGGIAHDFNNLLQGVFGYISMAKISFDRKDKALSMLEQAEKALDHSVNLTTQLLTFSKGGKPVKKLIDLRPVIEDSTKFTLSGSRSDFRMNLPPDLWQAEADAGQIGQVIQNIVLNADQAMPMGGSVIVTAANIAENDQALPPLLPEGNYVMIAIRDTGVGIPQQYIGKIFDPYFTTKEKGSGLGLATSYSIIRNHNGLIDVTTKPGEGSTFLVYLPAIVSEVRKEKTAAPAPLPAISVKRVLVMDDEEFLRNLSRELLGALGPRGGNGQARPGSSRTVRAGARRGKSF